MKINPEDKAMIWVGAYAIAMHANISSAPHAGLTPQGLSDKSKKIADIATETIVDKLKEIKEAK